MQITLTVQQVLNVFLEDPGENRYGLEVMRETGLQSGTLYPILARLERVGWLVSEKEPIDPAREGRPARRYYRLTPEGLVNARQARAALYEQLRSLAGPRMSGALPEWQTT